MHTPDWFRVDAFGHRVWRITETGLGPLHAANIWLVEGSERALLIDAGVGVAPLRPVVAGLTTRPVICLLTHSHYDHIGGGWEFEARWAHRAEAPILADPAPVATLWQGWLTDAAFDRPPHPGFRMDGYAIRPTPPTHLAADGEIIDLGDRLLSLLHVPGHSPGLLAAYEAATGLLFSSDALYEGRMFFDLPGSDVAAARDSLARLGAIPAQRVHPGHGENFDGARLATLSRQIAAALCL